MREGGESILAHDSVQEKTPVTVEKKEYPFLEMCARYAEPEIEENSRR